jgi:type II secretory pathway component PulM
MSALFDRLAGLMLERSRRERLALLALLVIGLPLFLLQSVALPMLERQSAARAALAEARMTELWVAEQALAHARLARDAGTSRARATTAIGISGIEAGLRAAGLREVVSELANTADGGITLRFDAVRFTALAEWLSGQSGVWGYDLAGFAFERGAREDVVAADLRLVPAR